MLKLLAFSVELQMKSKLGKERCGGADGSKPAPGEVNPMSEF